MGDLVITILIFVGVMGVTALLFGGWVVVLIFRFIVRALSGNTAPPPQQMGMGLTCHNNMCRASNPPGAQFCRRCGQSLGPSQRVSAVRRAALW
jgi:hypothetical protein